MRIGDHDLARDQARDRLCGYAQQYAKTVLWYDLAGNGNGQPGPADAAQPVNSVTLADVGRLVVIDARLAATDAPLLLGAATPEVFAAVPATARLEEWEPGNALDVAVTVLYDEFKLHGIGPAKRSKLLHIKRPWLVPIADTRVSDVYQRLAKELEAGPGIPGSGWWEAPKRDLVDNESDFAWLTDRLASDDDLAVRRLARLTALRLLDILAWTLGG
jgi:hypothetical protein